jgi:SAM-dependent methyltransferase
MFDDFADAYEAMIDWPKRLAHEEPFYRRLFDRLGVASVLDVACGTGQHAAMFHSWGLRVEGADLSAAMIDRARAKYGEPHGLRWTVRGFDQPVKSAEPFDVAICVGNSLALAPDAATVERAIRQMLAAVREGGAIVVQVLNLWRLPDGPCVWQKCRRVPACGAGVSPARAAGTAAPQEPNVTRNQPEPLFADKGGHAVDHLPKTSFGSDSPAGDALVLKGVHRCGDRGYVEMIVTDLSGDTAMRSESTQFLGLEALDLDRMAKAAGATKSTIFGGYQDQPYERQQSVDLVMAAER